MAAIEAGVDPAVVSERISSLKAKRAEAEDLLSQLDTSPLCLAGPEDSLAILEGLPDLGKSLASADPKLRRAVFDAFRVRMEIDRNAGEIKLKALVSSAFSEVQDLDGLVTHKAIAGAGFERISATTYRLTVTRNLA